MFDPRNVRAKVMQRAAIVGGNLTEDTIHDLYAKVMYEELEAARTAVLTLATHVDSCVARNPSKGWTMVSAEQRKETQERIRDILTALRAC